jgi:hypothetical protein
MWRAAGWMVSNYRCQGYGAIEVLDGSTINMVVGGQDEQGDNGVT